MAMIGQHVVAAGRGTIGPNSAYSLYSVQHQDNGGPISFRDDRVASTLTGLHATESISGPGVYCASRVQLERSMIWMIGGGEKCKVLEHGRGRHRLADFRCEAETHVRYSLGTPSLRLSRTQLRNCVVLKDCTWTRVLKIPFGCHNGSASRCFRSQAEFRQPRCNELAQSGSDDLVVQAAGIRATLQGKIQRDGAVFARNKSRKNPHEVVCVQSSVGSNACRYTFCG
jgi:hypothetical protein